MMFHHQWDADAGDGGLVRDVESPAAAAGTAKLPGNADRRIASATPRQRIGAPRAKAGKAATHSWISQENEQVLP
jgi:hypothetical protein